MKRVINGTSKEISTAAVEKVTEWDSKSEWLQREKKNLWVCGFRIVAKDSGNYYSCGETFGPLNMLGCAETGIHLSVATFPTHPPVLPTV